VCTRRRISFDAGGNDVGGSAKPEFNLFAIICARGDALGKMMAGPEVDALPEIREDDVEGVVSLETPRSFDPPDERRDNMAAPRVSPGRCWDDWDGSIQLTPLGEGI